MEQLLNQANDFLHQVIVDDQDRDEVLAYAIKNRKWASARMIMEAMQEKADPIIPSAEAFGKLFFYLKREWR